MIHVLKAHGFIQKKGTGKDLIQKLGMAGVRVRNANMEP